MKKLDERNAPLHFQYNVLEGKVLRDGVLMKVGGVFQRADTENANGRVYPHKLWTEVLQREDVVERIQNRRMVGMMGHPSSGQTDPEKVSHVITKQELRSDGTIYGEAEILDTPQGRIAEALFRAGVGLGVSSRGDGSVENKGGKDEVQDDYRLETYDFVLKPSTPGAYPGITESEEVEHHEKLVAEAIEGLVKSKATPKKDRIPVLTECLKILSVLEGASSGNLVEQITSQLKEELGSKSSTVLVVEQKPSQPENTSTIAEDNMPNDKPTAVETPQLSADTLKWHQQQVTEAVTRVERSMGSEIATLKDTVVKGQRDLTETRKRLHAAEKIIEDFQSKNQRLQEQVQDLPEDPQLRRRYKASVELLDEALKHLPELGSARRRIATLEGLLQASIDKARDDTMEAEIVKCLDRVDEQYHSTMRPILEKCKSVRDIEETFNAFVKVSRSAPTVREPLPTMAESLTSTPKPRQAPTTFTTILGGRLNRAV